MFRHQGILQIHVDHMVLYTDTIVRLVAMRTRSQYAVNRRYFHTKPKIDKQDITMIKKKRDIIHQRNLKKELEQQFSK